MRSVPVALTIAGSDSGGGAGIQADLRTFAALGVYGTCVLTAVTAQNSREVLRQEALSPGMVRAQLEAVMRDIGCEAAKTGMLGNAGIVAAVTDAVREYRIEQLVVDPVMAASSGGDLFAPEALDSLRDLLLPLALVLTPNLPEAERLVGSPLESPEAVRRAARRLHAMGARKIVIKGGHTHGSPSPSATDLFYDGKDFRELTAPRLDTPHTHGTGCTFSAAIAAHLARGADVERAVELAKAFVTEAIRHGFPLGHGPGPVHQLHALWRHERGASR